MNYSPKYFKSEELVDPDTFEKLGDKSLNVCFDLRILYSIDMIREFFNSPITVNNWKIGGNFKYRGFRPFNCSEGADYSPHKFGRAIDFDVKGETAEQVRHEIKVNQNLPIFKYITRMEEGVNWVHIDCGNYDRSNGIILFHQ